MEESISYSMKDAANYLGITYQALFTAIKKKRIKRIVVDNKKMVPLDELDDYKKNKWSRKFSTYEGRLLFDGNKRRYSANEVAKMLNVTPTRIYYYIRMGYLKADKKGGAYVIYGNDINIFRENKKNDDFSKRKMCDFNEKQIDEECI